MSEAMSRLSLQEFADNLASKQPVPGGGAVAAVTACNAAALGCMVLAYTLGKPKYAAFEEANKAAHHALHHAQREALALADRDAAAYGALSALMKVPAGDPKRAAEEPAALREAIAAPMAILTLSQGILKTLQPLVASSNPNLASDLAIAAKLAEAAADAAAWNVRVNLPQLPAGAERAATESRLNQSMSSVHSAADTIDCAISDLLKAK
ncbi:MAG: cyclodeaminase/cyclohydrolase family protein [Planctomycetes bacterium]|nr:cyclodeaminase/cyclohydrolase family protein [Planctomycetota bacterium]